MTGEGDKVIVGLGKTGLSCARYLARRGEAFRVADSRSSPPGLEALRHLCPGAPLALGPFRDETFAGAKELILSPGVDPRQGPLRRAMQAGARVTGDVDIFSREVGAPVVAITGSNAKSTVTTLVGEMARRAGVDVAVAGNIGTPVLDLLEDERKQLYVLELSSFQLETTENLGAEVATVLNMSIDHMDRYDSMQAYHGAKQRIFRGCRQAVVNRDDPLSEGLLPPTVKRWSFGLSRPDFGQFGLLGEPGAESLAFGREALMPAAQLRIAGRHNVSNALAALALGHAVGLGFDRMCAALRDFPGLPHRCQWVADIDGVSYYNDSKGTNVGATVAAIEGLASMGRVILLAGGVGKGADFSGLAEPLRRHARIAVLFGEDAPRIEQAIAQGVQVARADSLEHALAVARERARPGEVVLLSPACASFDMFRNYEHRGDVFTRAVKEMGA